MALATVEMTDQQLTRDEYFNQGLKADKEGNLQEALGHYRSALQIDPGYFLAWLNTGAVYARANKSENAIQCYEKALKIKREPKVLYNLASERFKADQYEEVQDLLDECLELNPEFTPALMLQAYNYGKLNQNEDAAEILDRVIELEPDHVPALTALVLLHFHSGEFHTSEEYLDKVLDLDSDNLMLSKVRARLLIMRNDLQGSIDTLKEIAVKDQRLQDFSSSLDSITPETKSLIEAKLSDIIDKENKDESDFLNLSLLQLFNGNIEEALDSLKNAAKAD